MLMLLLVCASLAAMAFGVLVAYAICKLMFIVFRYHVRSHADRTLPVSANAVQSAM